MKASLPESNYFNKMLKFNDLQALKMTFWDFKNHYYHLKLSAYPEIEQLWLNCLILLQKKDCIGDCIGEGF